MTQFQDVHMDVNALAVWEVFSFSNYRSGPSFLQLYWICLQLCLPLKHQKRFVDSQTLTRILCRVDNDV